MHHNAVHFGYSFSLQHFVALVPADDVARHLVPDDGIDVPEIMQAAFDLSYAGSPGFRSFLGLYFAGFNRPIGMVCMFKLVFMRISNARKQSG